MASRDGTPEISLDDKPKDRRIPLSRVVFREPTLIPGCDLGFVNITVGEPRNIGGSTFTCPQPFLDPVLRSIFIEGREYPLERVHYWERAKMARKVVPAGPPTNYRIGKR